MDEYKELRDKSKLANGMSQKFLNEEKLKLLPLKFLKIPSYKYWNTNVSGFAKHEILELITLLSD